MRIVLLAAVVAALGACADRRCGEKVDPGVCKACVHVAEYDSGKGRCMTKCWGGCDGYYPFSELSECRDACE